MFDPPLIDQACFFLLWVQFCVFWSKWPGYASMETALVYHPTLSSDVWRSRPEDDLPLICLFFFRFLFLSVRFTASFVWKSLPFGPRSTAIHWFIDLLSTTLHGRCSQPNLPATTSLIHLVRRRSYRTALRRRRDQDGTKGKGIKKKERSKLKHKKEGIRRGPRKSKDHDSYRVMKGSASGILSLISQNASCPIIIMD